MKLLYDNTNGKIYYAVYETEYFKFIHTTNIPLTVFEIDELDPENKYTCRDLVKYGVAYKVDINGDNKYYMVDNAGTWELHDVDGWIEHVEDI